MTTPETIHWYRKQSVKVLAFNSLTQTGYMEEKILNAIVVLK